MKTEASKLIITVFVLLLGAGIAWAGSQGGITIGTVPVFALLVGIAFFVQVVAFVPAFIKQSERFYDLTGSLTYISMTVLAVALAFPLDVRSAILSGLIIMWAARLGAFLFSRVHKSGNDRRFDKLKPSFVGFLNVWVIQGLWVTLTASAAWAAITSAKSTPIDAFAVVGIVVWLLGFGIEVVADAQKRRFRAEPANKQRFISTGLWSWSRHPNYFGEITLGGQDDYEAYKARTSVLVPLPPRK